MQAASALVAVTVTGLTQESGLSARRQGGTPSRAVWSRE